MFGKKRSILVFSLILILFLFKVQAGAIHNDPVKLEKIGDTGLSTVTLEAKAAERLGIATSQVTTGGIIPYASLIYDENGATWVYIKTQPLTYQRQKVVVNQINGQDVSVTEGPSVGTAVVIVGVDELYGAEKGIGK